MKVKVLVSRLLKIGPKPPYCFCSDYIDKKKFNQYKDIYNEQSEHLPDSGKYRNMQYDYGRIKHFVNHPEEIDAIKVSTSKNYYSTNIYIDNGYHRFLAAQIRGLKYIEIEYNGPREHLLYLKGIIKNRRQLNKKLSYKI